MRGKIAWNARGLLVCAAALLVSACTNDYFGLPGCHDADRGPFWTRLSVSHGQIQDPAARPLTLRLRAGETIQAFVADTVWERPVETPCSTLGWTQSLILWRSSNREVAFVSGDGHALGVLQAVRPGTARIWADVRLGAVRSLRAEPSYRCCTGAGAGSCPAQPAPCQDVPIGEVVVVPE